MIGSDIIGSDFLIFFLQKDLLVILISLFGLNIAVLSILISKLSDSKKEKPELDINDTTYEMKYSLIEFFVLICVAFFSLILIDSEKLVFEYKAITFSSLLLSTLIYSLIIIWDTGNGIFILVQEENKANKD